MKPESGTTSSVWMSTFDVPQYDSLKQNTECDVCVVGAGITGLTAAYMLTLSGKKVIVVDDGSIGGGESARTTAHITNVIDDRYYHIENLHGKEGARLAAESQTAAVNMIEKIVRDNNIECDFTRLTGYLLFSPDDDADELDKEYDACKRAGIEVKISDKAPIDCFGNYPCLEFPNQGEFHMLKYLSGLAKAITDSGSKIYTGTHISSIKEGTPAVAETKDKLKIKAKDIVVATNSPVSDYVAIHTKQVAHRTYVIGVNVPKNSIPNGLYWDTEEPYHYIRLYKQFKENDVLIVGGEDHKTGQDDDPEEHFLNLEKWTREKFQVAGDVKYKWSGQVLEPLDGLSFIGKDPENSEHVYIATGDSGMGITHGTYSAILLDDMINGRENKWADLYDPKRITLKTTPKFLKEGFNTAVQYIDLITPPEAAAIDEIAAGTGAIMKTGLDKFAVYKDNDGKVYKFSALCPHLKCVVEWNKVEKTWDCPCHGSRFDAKGKVINGPALANLKTIE
jgi:glycine/D-amino acid oxidase-like deaminating enzyme/nitrite reductase/ring-hydroxylating ferredoxin subunit